MSIAGCSYYLCCFILIIRNKLTALGISCRMRVLDTHDVTTHTTVCSKSHDQLRIGTKFYWSILYISALSEYILALMTLLYYKCII